MVEGGGDGGGDDLERVAMISGGSVDISTQVTEGDVEAVVVV